MAVYQVPVGVSNKHVHLSQENFEVLFGKGAVPHIKKYLNEPGQYACEETVDVVAGRGVLKKVRVLGPFRGQTQVELAQTDCRTLGISAPIRMSGDLRGSAPCKLVGPAGELDLEEGIIVAWRHVHLSPAQAEDANLKPGMQVRACIGGERQLIFDNVVVRSGPEHNRELHLDTDEANAAGVVSGDLVELLY